MEYTKGYLAFIDILGFSHYVGDENNGEKTRALFDFVEKFCYLFNTSPELEIQVSFFSDTIIITSNNLDNLIVPIYIAESYLKDKLELLFRGGITYGKYYHNNGTTFGPAVIAGHELEKQAVYSRILIDPKIPFDEGSDIINYYNDTDGLRCLNPYGVAFLETLQYKPNGIEYPENVESKLIEVLRQKRTEIIAMIEKNKGSSVVDKYLWRIKPYNDICRFVLDVPYDEIIIQEINYSFSDSLKEQIRNLIIPNDILDNNAEK